MKVAREKDGDNEVLRAHVAISAVFLTREQVDVLLRQPREWFNTCFFDQSGAPVLRATLSLPALITTFAGRFISTDGEVALTLTDAELYDVDLSLTKLGAELSGKLMWKARGDEAEDSELLLGQTVKVVGAIFDAAGGTPDMLAGVNVRICEHAWNVPRRVLVCGVDCHPGDANCNNYCNRAPQKGPMAAYPPKGPDA